MPRHARNKPPRERRFGWRDALAFMRATPNVALSRDERVSFRSLARISAVDMRSLPPRRHFVASDGGRIAYRSYSSLGAGHLVLVHGAGCFGDQFHRLANHLAEANAATVHTLDMRGHGLSDPISEDYDRFARDIGEFIGDLRRRTGKARIALGGHSAGGGLVMNAINRACVGELAGCLLLAPYLAIDSKSVRPQFGGWLSEINLPALALVATANLFGIERFNQKPLVRFNSEAFLHDPRFKREWPFAAVFGFGPGPAAARRKPIRNLPVLLIAGDKDECFRAGRYESALAAFATDAKVALMPNLGHWDILAATTVLERCTAWFDQQFANENNQQREIQEKTLAIQG